MLRLPEDQDFLPRMRFILVPHVGQAPCAARRPLASSTSCPSNVRFSRHFTQYPSYSAIATPLNVGVPPEIPEVSPEPRRVDATSHIAAKGGWWAGTAQAERGPQPLMLLARVDVSRIDRSGSASKLERSRGGSGKRLC